MVKKFRKPSGKDIMFDADFVSKPLRRDRESVGLASHLNVSWSVAGFCVCILVGLLVGPYSFIFKASLLSLPYAEFSGTELPVKKVPIWTSLSEAERQMTYGQLPDSRLMNLPAYDLGLMRDGREWRADNAEARNTYITYPVPNLGNYQLDGTENSGSHPGIDIKLPVGTPIHSIANGVVYKVQDKTTGFGKAISVAHVKVPDPENPGKKVTLVSTYAHLSKINVQEGQTIGKGQVIGLSGDTGFSTAPHLHFQVDRETAPFIPYWPFTWNELQAAGFSSNFDAVKAGLGADKARLHTTHPVAFINQFSDFNREQNLVVQNGQPDTAISNEIVKVAPIELVETAPSFNPVEPVIGGGEVTETPESESTENLESRKIVKSSTEVVSSLTPASEPAGELELTWETDRSFVLGQTEIITLRVNDAGLVQGGLEIFTTNNDGTTVTPHQINQSSFVDNRLTITVEPRSETIFKVVVAGDFGEVRSGSLRPAIFTDVATTNSFASAIKYLKAQEIVAGYDDGSFKPDQTLNRAEGVKIILKSFGITLTESAKTFPDVHEADWFYDFVKTAFERDVVKGYSDGYFRPGNTITRAEFIKVAVLAAGLKPAENLSSSPYQDAPSDAWFTPYLAVAKDRGLLRLKKGGFVTPNQAITRAEAAEVIYKLSVR